MSSSRWYQWLRRSIRFSSSEGAGRLRRIARRGATAVRRFSPRLEALEDRLVPSGGYDFGKIDDPQAAPGPATYPGTFAIGINDSLNIAGQYSDANGVYHGFLFSKGQYVTLDDSQAGTIPNEGTDAIGISPSGQIVGTYYNDSDGNFTQHAFLLVNGQYTTIDVPNNTEDSLAEGINASGQIVGFFAYEDLVIHGFLLSGGQYTTLDDPNAGTGTQQGTCPIGVNASGQIVGFYTDANNFFHGFLLSGGQYTTLDDPNAVGNTLAVGINDSGQIVGEYSDATGVYHGFVLSGGQYTTVDNPNVAPGSYGTAVDGINNTGQIVGFYTDSNNFYHGYAANPVNHGPVAPASESAGAAAMSDRGASSLAVGGRPVGRGFSVTPFSDVLVVSPRTPLLNAEATAAAPLRVPATPKTLVVPGPIHSAVPQDQPSSAVRMVGKPDAIGKALDQVFANFHDPLAIALSDGSTLA